MSGHYQSTGFAPIPWPLMDAAPRSQFCMVYAWLHRHGWASAEGCWASINSLAEESKVGHNTVRAAIAWLKEHGWIEAIERPGYTTIYRVRIEQVESGMKAPKRTRKARSSTPTDSGTPTETGRGPLPKSGGGGSLDREGTPTQIGRGPLPKSGDKQEPLNKNPRTRKTEDPPSAAHSLPPQPAAAAPTDLATRSKATPARQAFRPKASDVPIDLQPLADDLLGFWSSKTGARNERAWNMLLTAIRQIRDDAQGGVAVARQQLEDGSQAGWTSVTYANWQRYGRKPQRRGLEDHPYLQHLHGARPTRSEVAVANVQRMYETGEHWLFQK